jgi:hypothetical protein
MKAAVVFVIPIVALLIVFESLVKLIAPVARHCFLKYQHYQEILQRREQFYRELKVLMAL